MKFKEYVVEWEKEKKEYVKLSTINTYKFITKKHLIPFFGEMELGEIDNETATSFAFKELDDGISRKSVRDEVMCLKIILKSAATKGLTDMPLIDIKYPKKYDEIKETLEVLDQNDYKKIISFCKENINSYNLGILISCLTGMRIGEVCGLKWKDINFSDGIIEVNRTLQRIYDVGFEKTQIIESEPKTFNSHRQIPITRDLMNVLKPLSKIYQKDKYVIALDKECVEPRTLRVHFKKLLKLLKIKDLKFHGLRHSFATRLIEKGVDVKTVSAILGHSNVSLTMNLYVHPTNENKKKAIMKAFRGL